MASHPKPDLSMTRKGIREGTIRAAEAMQSCLSVALSPACDKAFVRPMFEQAREIAAARDRDLLPLAGLAVSVKDLFDIQGQVTLAGSRTRSDVPAASRDCPAVERLRRAGAAIVGAHQHDGVRVLGRRHQSAFRNPRQCRQS